MIARRSLLAVALIAGSIAGTLYFFGAQRVPVVVAAQDLEATRPLTALDVEIRSLPHDALPPGAVTSVDEVIGRVPVAPLWQGQPLVARGLAQEVPVFQNGLSLRPGERAIAIPVVAVGAIGGAVAPGVRVDVLAVPVVGRAPAGRTVELMAVDALVLDVRAESGAPYVLRERDGTFAVDRIASVILAISAVDEVRFADRIVTSTFVLAFSSAR